VAAVDRLGRRLLDRDGPGMTRSVGNFAREGGAMKADVTIRGEGRELVLRRADYEASPWREEFCLMREGHPDAVWAVARRGCDFRIEAEVSAEEIGEAPWLGLTSWLGATVNLDAVSDEETPRGDVAAIVLNSIDTERVIDEGTGRTMWLLRLEGVSHGIHSISTAREQVRRVWVENSSSWTAE
jgi:hypothetical protein